MSDQQPWKRIRASISHGFRQYPSGVVAEKSTRFSALACWSKNALLLVACGAAAAALKWIFTHRSTTSADFIYQLGVALAAAWVLTYPKRTRMFLFVLWLFGVLLFQLFAVLIETFSRLAPFIHILIAQITLFAPLAIAVRVAKRREQKRR